MIIGLADLKAHLRVDSDDENLLIQSYGEAAEEQVRNWIGRPIYADATDMPLPGAVGHSPYQIVADRVVFVAVLMIADALYHNRAGTGDTGEDAVPPASVRALLAGHRVFAEVSDANQ